MAICCSVTQSRFLSNQDMARATRLSCTRVSIGFAARAVRVPMANRIPNKKKTFTDFIGAAFAGERDAFAEIGYEFTSALCRGLGVRIGSTKRQNFFVGHDALG